MQVAIEDGVAEHQHALAGKGLDDLLSVAAHGSPARPFDARGRQRWAKALAARPARAGIASGMPPLVPPVEVGNL